MPRPPDRLLRCQDEAIQKLIEQSLGAEAFGRRFGHGTS